MTTKQKQLLERIKREVKAGYKGMNEFEESLEDSGVCTCHFDNIDLLVDEILRLEE